MIKKIHIYEAVLGMIFTFILQAIKNFVQGKKSNIKTFLYCVVSGIGFLIHFLLRKDLVYKAKELEKEKERLQKELEEIKKKKKKKKKKN